MVYQQLAEQYLSLQQQQRALLQHQHQLQTLLDDKTQQLQQLMDTSVSFYRDVHMGPFSQHPMPNTLLSRNAPPPMPTCNTLPPQSLTSNTFSPKPLTSLIRSMRDIAANHDALLQSSRERQQHMGDMDDVALVQQAMHALEEMWRTLTTVHGAPGCASSAFVKERLPPVAVRQQCIEQCVEEHVCSTSHADDHTYHHGHHAVGALLVCIVLQQHMCFAAAYVFCSSICVLQQHMCFAAALQTHTHTHRRSPPPTPHPTHMPYTQGYHAFTPQQVKTLMAIRMSFVTTWQCLLKERRVLVTDMQHAVQCRGKDMGVEGTQRAGEREWVGMAMLNARLCGNLQHDHATGVGGPMGGYIKGCRLTHASNHLHTSHCTHPTHTSHSTHSTLHSVMHFLQHVHEHVFLNHPLAGVQLLCKAWPHVPDGLSLVCLVHTCGGVHAYVVVYINHPLPPAPPLPPPAPNSAQQ